ncbi:hypothetical protein ACQ86O_21245 [Serratia sp. L9]|uniref:hypothetical protein n=1 Tax=Serratia sp. L9 TaxID=3423946 RepID=UPI003D679508
MMGTPVDKRFDNVGLVLAGFAIVVMADWQGIGKSQIQETAKRFTPPKNRHAKRR